MVVVSDQVQEQMMADLEFEHILDIRRLLKIEKEKLRLVRRLSLKLSEYDLDALERILIIQSSTNIEDYDIDKDIYRTTKSNIARELTSEHKELQHHIREQLQIVNEARLALHNDIGNSMMQKSIIHEFQKLATDLSAENKIVRSIKHNSSKLLKKMWSDYHNHSLISKYDSQLVHIVKKYSLNSPGNHLAPCNLTEAKKICMDALAHGHFIDPIFEYEPLNIDVREAMKELIQLPKLPQTQLGKILSKKRREMLLTLKLIESRGSATLTQRSIQLYGKPDAHTLKSAQGFMHVDRSSDKPTLNANQAAIYLRKSLKEYGLCGWRVKVVKKMAARAACSPSRRLIELNAQEHFSVADVKRLAVHEIGTHAMRTIDGEQYFLKILSLGLAGYLPTEEGLAVLMEERKGVSSPDRLKIYAARTLAVNWAQHMSFSNVVKHLLHAKVTPKDAVDIACRTKRGLTHTAQPGGFTRDYLYLKGYLDLKHLADNGFDIRDLFIGKIPIEDSAYFAHHHVAIH